LLSAPVQINYEKCAIDVVHFANDLANFIELFQSGNYTINEILTDVEALLNSASAVLTDCGNSQINFNQYITQDPAQCITDLYALSSIAQ
jgi:hypothetical protein